MATMIIPSKAFGARTKRSSAGTGLLARIVEAIRASRQREADAVVARYMAGRWTDSVEREINDRLIRQQQTGLF